MEQRDAATNQRLKTPKLNCWWYIAHIYCHRTAENSWAMRDIYARPSEWVSRSTGKNGIVAKVHTNRVEMPESMGNRIRRTRREVNGSSKNGEHLPVTDDDWKKSDEWAFVAMKLNLCSVPVVCVWVQGEMHRCSKGLKLEIQISVLIFQARQQSEEVK